LIQPPEIGHLRVFGATTWVHVPGEKRQKLDPKSVRCLLVGYEEDARTRVYRLYNPEHSKILVSRDVIIDQSSVIHNPGECSSTTKIELEKEGAPEDPKEGETNYEDFQPLDSIIPPAGVADSAMEMEDSITLRPRSTGTDITGRENNSSASTGDQSYSHPRPSQRMRKTGGLVASQAYYALLAGQEEHEPVTLTDALSCNEREKSRAAWESELTSLAENNTWVIEPLPEDRSAIGCRWVFKKKEDGRYKARRVAKGYSQQHGIDYEETFAPVAKLTTIRILLALSCENDWKVEGMDVKTAFLNGELDEQLYMEIQEGVTIPDNKNHSHYNRPLACTLIKLIYGLKLSPRALSGRIHRFFLINNFTRSDFDHSLFINYERQVILLLYVDDLVVAAPTANQIRWIRNKLHDEFDMTDLGPVQTFLGLEIWRNQCERTLPVSQSKYIQRILNIHKMDLGNPALTPADPHV